MIALDTNVLVRLLVKDDTAQLALARSYLRENCTPENPALINRVVLAEFVWVLESCYGYPRERVAQAIDGLLAAAVLGVEDAPSVRAALARYRGDTIDFADALIAMTNLHAGASTTLTFDKNAARRLQEFSLVK